MKFIIASKNKHKLCEFKRILTPLGIELVTEDDCDFSLPEVDETGTTFAENAFLKAQSALSVSHMPSIADDSGLSVDYLNGAPGIYSSRYSGEHANDKSNNEKLLKELSGVPMEKRTAQFICSICLLFPNGDIITANGKFCGKIGFEPVGEGGFGYDPLFIVNGKSVAQLPAEQKDKISHRGLALTELEHKLKEYINADK